MAKMMKVKSIYRHKVSKGRWQITLESGKTVIVTEDHSIMVERNNKLIEICARDINIDTDICVSVQ
jgi:intein/homing endonuclease